MLSGAPRLMASCQPRSPLWWADAPPPASLPSTFPACERSSGPGGNASARCRPLAKSKLPSVACRCSFPLIRFLVLLCVVPLTLWPIALAPSRVHVCTARGRAHKIGRCCQPFKAMQAQSATLEEVSQYQGNAVDASMDREPFFGFRRVYNKYLDPFL